MSRADDVRVSKRGELLREVKVSFRGGGIVAFKAVAGEDRFDVGVEKSLAALAFFLGCRENGFGFAVFFKEGDDFVLGQGAVVESDVMNRTEPRTVCGEFISKGKEVGVIPVIKVSFDGCFGRELTIQKKRCLTVGCAGKDEVRALELKSRFRIERGKSV